MKLTRLYSNNDATFPRIDFADALNVVFARVRDPSAIQRDSHNLGKTFLITVIDFTLLAKAGKEHSFRINSPIFDDFIFYLELQNFKGEAVTVRRPVVGRQSIALHFHQAHRLDLRNLQDQDWSYQGLGLEAAQAKLDAFLSIAHVKPENYRKLLRFFLRRQADYNDVFELSAYSKGKDRDWKPAVAELIGMNGDLVRKKYELDESRTKLVTEYQRIEANAGKKSEYYDEIKGEIEIRDAALLRAKREINSFSFRAVEEEISDDLVARVESRIADLNEKRYKLDFRIAEAKKSLDTKLVFSTEVIETVFKEAKIFFSESLRRSYHDLAEFNRRVSSGRETRLKNTLEKLIAERKSVMLELEDLDRRRVDALRILTERETFEKYRELQKSVISQEAELAALRFRLETLDEASIKKRQAKQAERELQDAVERIEASIQSDNEELRNIRQRIATLADEILGIPALLSVTLNEHGNPEFGIRTLDRKARDRDTHESEGASYKKLLCACFDLAVLATRHREPFYRFVYHDGIFEGLDNRRKVALLRAVRTLIRQCDLQYILTVIDSDLPRDIEDNKLLFDPSEIVRQLDDSGDQGRLFRMPTF